MSYVGARKRWVEAAKAQQAVARGCREVSPGILSVLSGAAIVCECQAAASSSVCWRGLKISTVVETHTYECVNTHMQSFSSSNLLQITGRSSNKVCVSLSAGHPCKLHHHCSTQWPVSSAPSSLHTFPSFSQLTVVLGMHRSRSIGTHWAPFP